MQPTNTGYAYRQALRADTARLHAARRERIAAELKAHNAERINRAFGLFCLVTGFALLALSAGAVVAFAVSRFIGFDL